MNIAWYKNRNRIDKSYFLKITWIKIVFPLLYLLVAGFVFAGELYTRISDRGNSEMSGLGTYLLTPPAFCSGASSVAFESV
jgi:hypothetical protein